MDSQTKLKLGLAFSFLKLGTLGLIFGWVTVFVFLNSAEIIFNMDMPFVHALDSIRSTETLRSVVGDTVSDTGPVGLEKIGNFGIPNALKIPVIGSRLSLNKAIFSDGRWLSRSGNGHYMIIGNADGGTIGNVVVYTRSNWRTISEQARLKIGDNIFLDTDSDWRYMFRIVNRSVLRFGQPYVKSDVPNGSMIFVVEDEQAQSVFVFECAYVSIQNIRQ